MPPDVSRCAADTNFVVIPCLFFSFFYFFRSSDGRSVFSSFESVDMMDNVIAFDCKMTIGLAHAKVKEILNLPDSMTDVESPEKIRKPLFCSRYSSENRGCPTNRDHPVLGSRPEVKVLSIVSTQELIMIH
jgi:hypothetical protein